MIKVSFQSANGLDDVCTILENILTNQMNIEQWLVDKIKTIEFECMDYPHDLEAFFDCPFECSW